MTFIITLITPNGISMASDSNITMVKGNNFRIKNDQVAKTEFFEEFNLGISIWGKFKIDNTKIWDFIKENLQDFFDKPNEKSLLPDFLKKKLNDSLPASKVQKIDKEKQFTQKLGIHLATYLSIDGIIEPVLYHITNDRSSWEFVAQPDIHPSNNRPPYIVFNGIYEPFSLAREHFQNYFESTSLLFQEIIKKNPKIQQPNRTDEYNLEKELKLIITTIKQYQAILEHNGLIPIIGGKIQGICFNQNGFIQELTLNDI